MFRSQLPFSAFPRLHISNLNAELQISVFRTNSSLSVNAANLSECLFDNPADCEATSGPMDALRVKELSDSKYTLNHTQVCSLLGPKDPDYFLQACVMLFDLF